MGGFAPVGYGTGSGTVTAVTATSPIASSGGSAPNITLPGPIALSLLAQGGAVTSDVLTWNGTDWVPELPASGGVTSVTATGPIASTGGDTPVISISPATDSAAGSMSAADKTAADALNALLSATGGAGSGTLTNTAETVVNQISAGSGVITQVSQVQTIGAVTDDLDFAVPANTAGIVSVLIIAASATDGGAVTYSGKLLNLAGTITAIAALAAQDTWQTSSGGSTWTAPNVSVAGSSVQVQVTGTITVTINWTVVFQWASAPT